MDFLDTLDTGKKDKKSHRVRSWYLYEQYKSLERSQLDAAQKLKNKSSQDRILRQELHERRVRRKLYDHCDFPRNSDSQTSRTISEGKSLCSSSDDFFESFCELEDDKLSRCSGTATATDTEEVYSQDDSQRSQSYLSEFKSLDNVRDDHSYEESVNSVIDNYKSNEDLAADIQEKLTLVEKSIAEKISQQLETVKENIECLEKYAITCNDGRISENGSLVSSDVDELKVSEIHTRESDITVFYIWSKLVSFAYQVIQLNHGNCYYDYGSQFLTAVLACDVLRKGVSRMCHILQPYISPIKYPTTDESDSSLDLNKHIKKKKVQSSKKFRNSKVLYKQNKLPKVTYLERRRYSDNYWHKLSKYTSGHKGKKQQRHSEPCRSKTRGSCQRSDISNKSSSSSIWPSFSKDPSVDCECACHTKVTNPMLKIGQYIDKLLRDIDECQRL